MAGGWCRQLWLRTTKIRKLWEPLGSCGIIFIVWWVLENAGCSLVKTYPSRFMDGRQNGFPKKILCKEVLASDPCGLHSYCTEEYLKFSLSYLIPLYPVLHFTNACIREVANGSRLLCRFQHAYRGIPRPPQSDGQPSCWPSLLECGPSTHTYAGTSLRVLKVRLNTKFKLICYLLNDS